MSRLARTASVALISHLVFAGLAWITAHGVDAELRGRGVDLLEVDRVLEHLLREGPLSAPVRVLLAGLVAGLCLTPYFEAAVASAAARASSFREAFRDAVHLTPASVGLGLLALPIAALVLALAALAPWAIYALTTDVHDDLRRAWFLGVSLLPAAFVALAFGVTLDVGRLRIARGHTLREALVGGLRAVFSSVLPLYGLTVALGFVAGCAHAALGRNDDASSLVAGGVVLLVRPLSRALFMWVAARHRHAA